MYSTSYNIDRIFYILSYILHCITVTYILHRITIVLFILVPYGNWFDYILEWEDVMKSENSGNILHIHYEELKKVNIFYFHIQTFENDLLFRF